MNKKYLSVIIVIVFLVLVFLISKIQYLSQKLNERNDYSLSYFLDVQKIECDPNFIGPKQEWIDCSSIETDETESDFDDFIDNGNAPNEQ